MDRVGLGYDHGLLRPVLTLIKEPVISYVRSQDHHMNNQSSYEIIYTKVIVNLFSSVAQKYNWQNDKNPTVSFIFKVG